MSVRAALAFASVLAVLLAESCTATLQAQRLTGHYRGFEPPLLKPGAHMPTCIIFTRVQECMGQTLRALVPCCRLMSARDQLPHTDPPAMVSSRCPISASPRHVQGCFLLTVPKQLGALGTRASQATPAQTVHPSRPAQSPAAWHWISPVAPSMSPRRPIPTPATPPQPQHRQSQ
jgi:hypothetical protein